MTRNVPLKKIIVKPKIWLDNKKSRYYRVFTLASDMQDTRSDQDMRTALEIAKELGCSRQRAWQIARLERGLCMTCGKRKAVTTRCHTCNRKRRRTRKAQ